MSIHLGMTACEYHKASGHPYLTSSLLRSFLRSPQLYRDEIDSPSRTETDAMRFGTAFHAYAMEPDRFAKEYAIKPEGMSFARKDGKAWQKAAAFSGTEIVSSDDYHRIRMMSNRMPIEITRMLQNPMLDNRHGNEYEVTIRNKLGSLDAQCRLDCWDRDGNMIYDLKTINAVENIEREVWKRGYHLQCRWYQRVVEAETGKRPAARLIFVETCAPYRWRVVEFDFEYTAMADAHISLALERLHECVRTDDWSDPADPADIHEMVSPPAWMREDNDESED